MIYQQTPATNDAPSRSIITTRLAAAAIQALALYLLARSLQDPLVWPASQLEVIAPAFLVSTLVPLLVIFGCNQMGKRALVTWSLLATAVLAGLGYHSFARETLPTAVVLQPSWFIVLSHRGLLFVAAPALFVAHVLVVDSIQERRLIPSDQRHLDTAWRLGLQVSLSMLFLATCWAILWLGASLFGLVGIDAFARLLGHDWFYIPATALAVALSIHVTDVQPALIQGARTLLLTLFSWLLPLWVILLAAFLGSIPFISLDVLWRTHFATTLLLWAALVLIFLINCCNAERAGPRTIGRIKRLAIVAGTIELVPLAGMAGWALALRVNQYGWSVARVEAAAALILVSCYTLGYVASLAGRTWLPRIGTTNVAAAYVSIALVLALFSPIADPARLMVASQLRRLETGAATPDQFDYRAMRRSGARWGSEALTELSVRQGPDSTVIAAKSKLALINPSETQPTPPEEIISAIPVRPTGRTLPDDFFSKVDLVAQNTLRRCGNQPCVALYLQLGPEAAETIALVTPYVGYVLERSREGRWPTIATLSGFRCSGAMDGVKSGLFTMEPHLAPDIVVNGEHITIVPIAKPCR